MKEKIIEKFETMLNEEKWTRATINNYTITNFEKLNELINEFKINNMLNEIKDIGDEYLKHNKNSIVALYVNSIIQLEEKIIDELMIYSLIKIFSDNLKWNIVEYLCLKALTYVEDKILLKTLITTYINLNRKDELPPLWERLIKVDYEEAEIVVNLAKIREENNEIEDAVTYYKKAINRFILSKNFIQVEELWKKLLTFENIGNDYYFNLDQKISKNFSIERSIELLKLLYQNTIAKDDYDSSIKVLKLILDKSNSDELARKEIVNIYRKKYKDHSQLEEYIRISNLEGSWRNIFDALDSFEKHIAFDKGNFVYHRSWGIGRIVDVSKDIFTINFQNKKEHKMSLKMALSSLQILPKNHIWILKLKNIDLLKKKVKEDILWALKIIIQSYNNQATLKNIQEELVPDVIQESKWSSWWNQAKKILKTDPTFGTSMNSNNTFEVREKPQTFEEKTFESFKNARDYGQRLNLILDYLEYTEPEPDPDFLEEMLSYFSSFLNSKNNVNENTIISYILVKDVITKYTFIKQSIPYSFNDYFINLEDPIKIYSELPTSDFKKEFLIQIKKSTDEWIDFFIKLFYLFPNKFIYDEILYKDFSIIEKIIKDLITRYKEYSDAFFWIVTNVLEKNLIEKLSINIDNIVFSVLHLIEITTKNINNKKELVKNKRLVKQLKDYLTNNNFLINYIEKADKEFSKRLYGIIDELIYLDSEYVVMIKDKIAKLYPDIDADKVLKFDSKISKLSIGDKILTTQESYERVYKEMIHIKDIEIPENSKEIGFAMEKGDLRENAEYKAAKEQQTFLNNKLNKLMNDLSKVQIIKISDISGDTISFGTKVKLNDLIQNKDIEYTILGPWESQTEKNIISYQSPLGLNLLDKKINEEVKFSINNKEYNYLVKEINIADF
ncbi:MAG: transcription elongation factor GreA [Spirochaetes bacterium]|nr:transcription elongation factor GreA [Spirochaetota bacterium]